MLYQASLRAQLVKNPPAVQETPFDSWVKKIHWRRARLPTPVFLGFSGGSVGKESTCNAGDLSSVSGLGRSLEEGNGYQLPYDSLTFLKLSPLHSILTHVLNSEFVPGPVPGAGEITDDKVQP